MPVKQESFNSNLYDLLKTRGYKPTPINSKGQNTTVPQEADVFKFEFKKNDEIFGEVWATVDNARQLVIYYDDEIADSPSDVTTGSEFDDSWTGLLRHLKSWAQRRQLGFELKNRDHLASDMAQREHMKKETLGEGYYPMGKKASYSDTVPQVKIILQHTRQIEEGEQRFRNIAKIFVENINGERFLVPTIRPGLARVYARHVAEGGTPYDERGQHITSLVEEYTKMAGFVRATRNNQFNESAQKLVNEGINHYQNLRETLSRMTGHRGYNQYFESYTPVLNEESDDNVSLNELFVQETLDPRIESVLPILKRLNKNISEMSEVKELEEWASNITEEQVDEALEYSSIEDLKASVNSAVMRRIMLHHPKLLKDLDNLEMAVDDAVSWFVGDGVEEVGSSDLSAIVRDVTQRMGERHADIDEGESNERPYVCVHAKKGKFECHAASSYEAVKKAAQHWKLKSTAGIDAHLADVEHTAVNEEDTENKSIMNKVANFATKTIGEHVPDSDPYDKVLTFAMKVLGLRDYKSAAEFVDKSISEVLGYKDYQELFNDFMSQVPSSDEDMMEDLDSDQERAGQLGPTEKVGPKGAVGKLVGASESTESTEEAITEMDSPGTHDDPYAKGGKATPVKADKAKKDFAKILQKNIDKSNKAKQDTEKRVAQHMKEGQEDLDAILRIVHK